ncbi:hypothetical protein BDZ97DRAFT_2046565 [Flammula alnicola]|nr:hypothetical protein BDZ97DRAFT_2046565 [Flammula alnicola]
MGHSPPPNPAQNGHLRRPLSPSSLRGMSGHLTHHMTHRKYPTPPTGHDLMAMFPPAPPDNFPEMRPGPTSGFFQRQERAFFAQAEKEIVRVRVEADPPHGAEPEPVKSTPVNASSRLWMNGPAAPSSSTIPLYSPVQSSSAPILYSHPSTQPSQRGVISATPAPLYPATSSHASPISHALAPSLHLTPLGTGLCTPPQDSIPPPPSKPEYPSEEYDEPWKQPTPCAERRRAGKHTRHVIVRK